MLLKRVALLGLAATAMSATLGWQPMPFGCGAGQPTEDLIRASMEMRLREANLTADGQIARDEIIVNVYVHVVALDETTGGGYITADTIEEQIKVLNENYAPSGISFILRNSTWTIHASWTNNKDESAMKAALRKGGYEDLNLYFINNFFERTTLGKCTFPVEYPPDNDQRMMDGCIMKVGTVPGGYIKGSNLGKTATHEVGHWFGLLHTFEGSQCGGPGDHIDDTPAQSSASYKCPTGKDSCPELDGLDPIHNYMDYSDE
ncbi:hypothetical protein QQS21_000464 [Conoideocrella luteorostrata]|uniref:Peptidase M43 pregnancy-associated plasma-A domain-containing protein n=1 Tax=Conoideocrella luteorostrata TaxID=1105319 RepID=A0AAJ0G2S4_9HYPO|nr:hypothetical protein QQS21_000464 [Conoideocrella luteorostrata]